MHVRFDADIEACSLGVGDTGFRLGFLLFGLECDVSGGFPQAGEGQEGEDFGFLCAGADEVHVGHVDGIEFPADEAIDEGVCRGFDRRVAWDVGELVVALGDGSLLEVERGDSFLTGDEEFNLFAGGLLFANEAAGGSEDAAIVRACEAAIAGDDDEGDAVCGGFGVGASQERMVDVANA